MRLAPRASSNQGGPGGTDDRELASRAAGILALIAGVLILIFPKLLNYLVAAYLIVVGLIQVFNIHV